MRLRIWISAQKAGKDRFFSGWIVSITGREGLEVVSE